MEMSPVRGRPKWPWVLGGALAFVVAAGLAAYVSEYGLRLPSWPWAAGDATQPPLAQPAATLESARRRRVAPAPARRRSCDDRARGAGTTAARWPATPRRSRRAARATSA